MSIVFWSSSSSLLLLPLCRSLSWTKPFACEDCLKYQGRPGCFRPQIGHLCFLEILLLHQMTQLFLLYYCCLIYHLSPLFFSQPTLSVIMLFVSSTFLLLCFSSFLQKVFLSPLPCVQVYSDEDPSLGSLISILEILTSHSFEFHQDC